jgi:hypothetical protein
MFVPYIPERVAICSHHLIIHAKVASTSLRTCGQRVDPHDKWDKPTIAIIRNPLQRWVAGYTMYLADLSRHNTGRLTFLPPHHFTYDVHTTQQVYKIRKDTHLIRFEDINEYADRCGFKLPHLHQTPPLLKQCRADCVLWMSNNLEYKQALKHHLRFDYKLREKCVSVQSLPENLFIK